MGTLLFRKQGFSFKESFVELLAILLAKRTDFILEGVMLMMFLLSRNIGLHILNCILADGECSVPALPEKIFKRRPFCFKPSR